MILIAPKASFNNLKYVKIVSGERGKNPGPSWLSACCPHWIWSRYGAGYIDTQIKYRPINSPTVVSATCRPWALNELCNIHYESFWRFSRVHKVSHAIFDNFWLPSPCHKLAQILDPFLKVCHTSEQNVNKHISRRLETDINNYNRYYILNNNKRPYWVF